MKATITLENVWGFIQSLSLSAKNKEWLAQKLIESSKEEKRLKEEAIVAASLTTALKEVKEAHKKGITLPDAYDLLNEL